MPDIRLSLDLPRLISAFDATCSHPIGVRDYVVVQLDDQRDWMNSLSEGFEWPAARPQRLASSYSSGKGREAWLDRVDESRLPTLACSLALQQVGVVYATAQNSARTPGDTGNH